AWRAALFGVYRVEFEEGPSLLRLALDGASPKLLLDARPLELLSALVVGDTLVERLRARRPDGLRNHERLRGTPNATQAFDERDRVRAEAERAKQLRRRDFGGDLRAWAVLHTQRFAGWEHAIELRRGASEIAEAKAALDHRWHTMVRSE